MRSTFIFNILNFTEVDKIKMMSTIKESYAKDSTIAFADLVYYKKAGDKNYST